MTTVAHADCVIASDSRFTFEISGHQIDGLVAKVGRFEDETILYGMAGRADFMALVHDYVAVVQGIDLNHFKIIFDQQPNEGKHGQLTFELIINANGLCHKFIFIQGVGFREVPNGDIQTAGSGGEYALQFLVSSSADAVKAVRFAIEKDPYSGGNVMATKKHHEDVVVAPFIIKAGMKATQVQELTQKIARLQADGYHGTPYATLGKYAESEIAQFSETNNVTFGNYDSLAAAQFLDKLVSQ